MTHLSGNSSFSLCAPLKHNYNQNSLIHTSHILLMLLLYRLFVVFINFDFFVFFVCFFLFAVQFVCLSLLDVVVASIFFLEKELLVFSFSCSC